MIIIAITGTIGSGKGAIVDYLVSKGFVHFPARDFILEEVVRRGLPVNRDSTTFVANELRKAHSPSYIIEQLYAKALKTASGKDCIIESVRTSAEIDFLKAEAKNTGVDFMLLAVDAPAELRYERVIKRKSALDYITFEKFVADEQREMTSTNPHEQNLSECMQRADVRILNEGSLEDLHMRVEEALHM